jgi:hypothetical protein
MLCPFCVALLGCPICFQVCAGMPGEPPLQPVVLAGQQGAGPPTLPSRSQGRGYTGTPWWGGEGGVGGPDPNDDVPGETDS